MTSRKRTTDCLCSIDGELSDLWKLARQSMCFHLAILDREPRYENNITRLHEAPNALDVSAHLTRYSHDRSSARRKGIGTICRIQRDHQSAMIVDRHLLAHISSLHTSFVVVLNRSLDDNPITSSSIVATELVPRNGDVLDSDANTQMLLYLE